MVRINQIRLTIRAQSRKKKKMHLTKFLTYTAIFFVALAAFISVVVDAAPALPSKAANGGKQWLVIANCYVSNLTL